MIVLHAALGSDGLRLWGEAAPTSTEGGETAPRHPFDAGAGRLTEAVSACPGGFLPDPERVEHVGARLPARGRRPLPSSPLVAPAPEGRGPIGLRRYTVSAVTLDPEETLTFLAYLPPGDGPRRLVAPGVVAAPDLAYCREALRFALELVARQRVLPGLAEGPDGVLAVWTPVLLDTDAARGIVLARTMPPAVRVLDPGERSADQVLRDFLRLMVDHVVRSSVWDDFAPPPPPDHAGTSVDRRWATALTAGDGRFEASGRELEGLGRRLDGWRRSLEVVTGSPFRLCFRLHEPPGSAPEPWGLRTLLQGVQDPSLLVPVEEAPSTEFLLASLGQASQLSSAVEAALGGGEAGRATLDTAGAHAFLVREAPALRQAGYGVLLPAWWGREEGAPRLSATVTPAESVPSSSGAFNLNALVQVEWDLVLGEERISREELEALAALKVPLVRARGQWIEVDPAEIRRLLERMKRQGEMTAGEAVRMALGSGGGGGTGGAEAGDGAASGVAEVQGHGWFAELLAGLRTGSGTMELLPQPDGLRGQLRPYQRRGLSWLAFLRRWGLGACLADDMGLGKTVQTLSLVQRDREGANGEGAGPVLLVCPTSVLGNWLEEARRFTPDLPVLLHHGPDRPRGDALTAAVRGQALVLTSYGLLHRDAEPLRSVPWAGVVLDEAQNIKNPDTLQARAARSIPAPYRIALTGTPVENHVGDLWSLMEFLNPGLLGTRASFRRRFLLPIQGRRDAAAAEHLRRLTEPFVLRRVKTDPAVAPDLPEKVETRAYCTLTPEQATLYRAVLRDAEEGLEAAGDDIQRRGLILSLLLRLKQVCNHPAHFIGDGSRLHGRSGKLARLTELLTEIMEEGERALVFTQFVEMGRMLRTHVQETFGREALFLHGGLPRRARDAMVARFQDDADPDRPPVFILSLKAGGTGLNLTAANHVFHFDRWWNPAVEDQATDRAFRIGQHRSVQVHKMVCRGTLEERIDRMIEEKKETARAVVGSGEGWLTELDDAGLRAVLALSDSAVSAGEEP